MYGDSREIIEWMYLYLIDVRKILEKIRVGSGVGM